MATEPAKSRSLRGCVKATVSPRLPCFLTAGLSCFLTLASTFVVSAQAQTRELPPNPFADSSTEGGGDEAETGEADEIAEVDSSVPLLPPSLIESPEVSLPADAEPIPPDSGVLLRVTIGADGLVADAEVEEGVREDVDALVLEAAREMRFAPARRFGVAVPAQTRFRFQVAAPEPAEPDEVPTSADHDATDTTTVPQTDSTDDTDVISSPPEEPDEPPAEPTEPLFGATAEVKLEEPGASTRITLTGEELVTVPGTFGEPLRVVATLPGVARTPFGFGFFFVRGANFDNTGFYVDGFPVPLLYHLGAGPAVLNSRLVSQLDFYPGGYPAKYGRFSAGVISVETGAPEVDSLRLEAEVDLLRASALAIIPFDDDRGVVSASFRRSYYELILPLLVDDVVLSYADWQLRLDYALSDNVDTSLFYFGSTDRFDVSQALGAGVGDAQSRSALGYGFHRVIGKTAITLPENLRLVWTATVGIDQTDLSQVNPGGDNVNADITGTFLGNRLELFVPEGEHFQTTVGLDALATLYDATSSFPQPPVLGAPPPPLPNPTTELLEVDPLVLSAAPYVEQVFRYDPIEITAAVRFDYLRYGRVSDVFVDPRGVVRYAAHEALTFKAASGLFTQPPQLFQIDDQFGAPELRPQRAWQSSAGFELNLPENIFIESQGFYSRMFSLPRPSSAFETDDDDSLAREAFVADGEGRSYGWELLVRRKASEGLYGWLSYTLSFSERFLENGETVPFTFDQRHTLNLAISYATGGWRFGARFQLSTGRPDRPYLGCTEDADADQCRGIRGGLTGRLPTFHQLDVRIDREFTINENFHGSVYLDVLNIYNSQNSEGIVYQWDGRASAALPSLPILGTIGVRLVYE